MSPAKRATTGKRASSRPTTADDREVGLSQQSEPGRGDAVAFAESPSATVPAENLEQRIRQKAYEIYCARNAGDGNPLEDWLAAEREIRFARGVTEGHAPVVLETPSNGEEREVVR
jgi:Protein of unknown function (DUF2934)